VTDLASGQKEEKYTKFLFIGAGGGSLPLLEKPMFLKVGLVFSERTGLNA
jgi:L-2-hydroxyglutarate oxidase LhgO